jgi:nucleotide-binding universal stress UspA family protein
VRVLVPDGTRSCPLPPVVSAVHQALAGRVTRLNVLVALGTHARRPARSLSRHHRARHDDGIPKASLVIREGDPFEELTRVAEEVRADAIVVGSSAQRLGSLAARLVKDARWPVTVVP